MKLIKTLLLALLSCACVSFAFGFSDNYYVTLNGTVGHATKSEATNTSAQMKYKIGYGVSGAVGMTYEQWRLEAEVAYRHHNGKDVMVGAATGSGDASYLAFMGNVFYDFDIDNNIAWYIGGGLGLVSARVKIKDTPTTVSDTDYVLGYQLMTGPVFYFNEQWAFSVGYRFFSTTRLNVNTSANTKVTLKSSFINSAEAAVRFMF